MAYAVLSDTDKRAHYDRFGFLGDANPFAAANVANATDFFDAMFGDLLGLGRKRSAAGRDLRYTLELDFEDAMLGCRRTIAFDRAEDCGDCRGTGAEGGAAGLMRCSQCGGQGFLRLKAGLLGGKRECAGCGGQGELPRIACGTCGGAGLVERRREFDVKIPPGTASGSAQRLPAQGSPGRRGGVAGDLHVVVRVKSHPFYGREGEVLHVDLPVSVTEAALGAEVDVPVLDGVVRMKLPPGTQSGSVFRIRGKGIPHPQASRRGDCHVRVTVEIPGAVGPEAEALFAALERVPESAQALPRRTALRAEVVPGAAARGAGEDANASVPARTVVGAGEIGSSSTDGDVGLGAAVDVGAAPAAGGAGGAAAVGTGETVVSAPASPEARGRHDGHGRGHGHG
jgi:molecular chaperone DnaJ